jgi:Helicase conserved C-terminal domain
MFKE